jgi:hypothetical protein
MKTCQLFCYHVNDLYSQEVADLNHGGEESVDNKRHHWTDELQVRNVKDFSIQANGTYLLKGEQTSTGPFAFSINEMRMVQMELTDGSKVEFAFSESILDNFEIQEEGDKILLKASFKDSEAFGNPIPGVYISNHAFPESLN